jgi:proteasome lid subunit RPN8/RPN11
MPDMAPGLMLPQAMVEAMLAHAMAELPNEACGLISGSLREGTAAAFHPARNTDASPLRYTLHPEDLVRITFALEEAGLDLLGIFHSHPRGAGVPSATDVREAMYPDAFHLLAGQSAPPSRMGLRAWRIRDGAAIEAAITVT